MKISSIRRLGLSALAGVVALGLPLSAAGVVQPGGQLPSQVAAAGTPHVLDGSVNSIAQVGGQMVLGGTFSSARNDDTTTAVPRSNLLAFDASTGRLSTTFLPQPNGPVSVVLSAGDGQSVYVGGKFTAIGGQARKNLARVRVSDGAVLPFDAGNVTGMVKDLRLVGGRLWLAGMFTHIAGHNQVGLATVDPQTGGFLPYMGLTLAGVHNGGNTGVNKIDVTPNGDRLVAIGNFDTLQGVVRHQLFQLDLTGDAARETTFNTRFFTTACNAVFNTYMTDVDYSPDGSFFVVVTTGAYGADVACDTSSRFETYASGATVQPTWVDATGGDTTHAVEIRDGVVYVGGHFRWQNNPFDADKAAQGAVAREGIAALDPSNGLPYSWNPGRARGVGVFDFLATDAGLWFTSDTDRVNGQLKGRVARMPLTGTRFPEVRSAELPNDIYSVGASSVTARSYRGGVLGAARPVSGLNAGPVKGTFMVNGYLYSAQSDGSFVRRSFDGTTFGAVEPVVASHLVIPFDAWRADAAAITGMFFENGRIYFTLPGSNALYYRYFTPESGVVGAQRRVASGSVSGIDFSTVRGMFFADGRLHWGDASGVLRSIEWRDNGPAGAPVAGTARTLSGPRVDGVSWTTRDMFVFQDAQGRPAPLPGQASFDQTCTSRSCAFDASSSTAPGGAVTGWAWDFGDGTTGTGQRPSHTYASDGTFTVRLTITSDRGSTATTTRSVTVKRVNQAPKAAFTASCHGTACSFDGSASSDPDGPVTHAWSFGDGTTGTGATPTHVYSSEGTRRVTLTVTDADGAQATTSQDVTATLAKVVFAGAAADNGNTANHRVVLPADVQEGDLLILHLALNSDVAIQDPAGWTALDSLNGGAVSGRAWSRRATAADAGTTVTVPVGAIAKGDLSVLAYRGTGGRRAVLADHRGRIDSTRGADHTSPTVTAPQGGGILATYWALKTSEDASWSSLGGQVARAGTAGIGGGRIVAAVADSATPVAAGGTGGLVGRSSLEVPRAIMFSSVIGLE